MAHSAGARRFTYNLKLRTYAWKCLETDNCRLRDYCAVACVANRRWKVNRIKSARRRTPNLFSKLDT